MNSAKNAEVVWSTPRGGLDLTIATDRLLDVATWMLMKFYEFSSMLVCAGSNWLDSLWEVLRLFNKWLSYYSSYCIFWSYSSFIKLAFGYYYLWSSTLAGSFGFFLVFCDFIIMFENCLLNLSLISPLIQHHFALILAYININY